MKFLLKFFVSLVLFNLAVKANCQNNLTEKIDQLVERMTLEEKIGQMTQITINYLLEGSKIYNANLPYKLDTDSLQRTIIDQKVGSILGGAKAPFTLDEWQTFITQIQDYAKKTRLQIPVLYGVDAIHGGTFTVGSTIFPQQIGQAATWNPDLVKHLAEITAYECRATGVPWNFSPVLDMGRNPLWSRFFETFGEDVYLAKTMGNAVINGYQGTDPSDQYHVAACMKHFLGYSVPLSGKDRTQTWIDERMLREYFLPTFQAAINANALTLMVNSGEINGIPVHANKHLLTDVLRTELGFDGLVVTDFKDIILLNKSHHIAKNYKEAVKLAINAGIDMSMVPMDFEFQKYLLELVNEGSVPMSRINESVKRILRVKYKLGLFENPIPNFTEYPNFGSKEFRETSLQAALESITLLKNSEDILPLNTKQKVLVCGPTSNEMKFLNGPWTYTWQGNEEKYYPKEKNTIKEAMQAIGSNNVDWIKGSEFKVSNDFEQLHTKAEKADVFLVCIGEQHGVEEAGNINNYLLADAQYDLVKKLSKFNKPIILVINSGRPQIITQIEQYCDAIITCYLPGNEGGDALAQIIYGQANPSGKLPFTWHKYPATISLYDHKYSDNNIEGEQAPYQPLFEFGHGLSYTSFEYSGLNISSSNNTVSDTLSVDVLVKNTGERAGKEVVQVYVSDVFASITPSVKRLRAYKKIYLESGKSKIVKFKIPLRDLSFVDVNYQWKLEAGEFIIQIDKLKEQFYLPNIP
jgi:beta-glucosidase